MRLVASCLPCQQTVKIEEDETGNQECDAMMVSLFRASELQQQTRSLLRSLHVFCWKLPHLFVTLDGIV